MIQISDSILEHISSSISKPVHRHLMDHINAILDSSVSGHLDDLVWHTGLRRLNDLLHSSVDDFILYDTSF